MRRGWRSLLAPVIVAAAATALLAVVRGPATAWDDAGAYQATFLRPFAEGHASISYTNQSLFGALGRLVEATQTPAAAARWIGMGCAAVVGVLYLFALRRSGVSDSASVMTISLTFLTWHLVSGITWKAHLVTMSFVFPAMMLAAFAGGGALRAGIIAAVAAAGLTGRDLVGKTAHVALGEASLVTVVLLLLWGFAWARSVREGPHRTAES